MIFVLRCKMHQAGGHIFFKLCHTPSVPKIVQFSLPEEANMFNFDHSKRALRFIIQKRYR